MKPSLNEIQKLAKDTHIETKKYFDKLNHIEKTEA